MPPLAAAFTALLLAVAGPIPGVPAPPDGKFEPELSRIAVTKAEAEMGKLLAELDKDASQPPAAKAEVKARVSRLKVAMYTTPKSIVDCVSFYTKAVKGATFLYAERKVLPDVAELAEAGGFAVPADVEKNWKEKSYKYARWVRDDGGLEIDVEDLLIDPRNGAVSKMTVVMITSAE